MKKTIIETKLSQEGASVTGGTVPDGRTQGMADALAMETGQTVNPKVQLSAAQARAAYVRAGTSNGKPVFLIPTTKVISLKSGFNHKKLCDGITFTLGLACHFTCRFCYVGGQLGRHPTVLRILKETGLSFDQVVIERDDPLPVLERDLTGRGGRPKFGQTDNRVVFASPLVDIAASLPTANLMIAACRMILEKTHWQIRLLSKSALLKLIAEALKDHQDRVIYGLSTGTFEDNLAMSFELLTASPSARLRTLYWLQDNGYRTYGMICPILPQVDYGSFAANAASMIRVDGCEHVWAEVLNTRGKSLIQTCAGLRKHGFDREAVRLELVSGPKHKRAWEEYARASFLSLSKIIPPEKLRFMQYVQPGKSEWWQKYEPAGALLLGAHA